MQSTVIRYAWIVVVALAVGVSSCGGDGGDADECQRCSTTEQCKSDQECVLAVDGNLRCFETDEATCEIDRVEVGRAPTPQPTP